jgi:phage tail sheath protein FI
MQAALPSKSDPSLETLIVSALESGAGEIKVEVSAASETGREDLFNITFHKGGKEEVFENVTLRKAKGVRNIVETVNRESKLVRIAEKEQALSIADRMPAIGTYSMTATASHEIAAVSPDAIIGNAAERTGIAGFEAADDVTMVCVPDLMALFQAGSINMDGVKAVQQAMLDHCANMKDRFAIIDCPPGMNPQEIKEWRMSEAGYDSKYGALYYPWIKVANPLGGDAILIPPCGHMAGIYARSDTERGVHKAPANEVVRGVIGLESKITKNEQDSLNPVGINCIRPFPGRGIRIWGARTLSSDALWRYINVRRLFNFVEESIEIGTQWVVFEPNDRELWERIKRDIKAFLTRVWRDGALFGATPDEAFYVKCDDELNTVEIRDAGQVIIEIGICPVKPAEFVIFRISQWAGGAAVSE